MNIPQQTHRHAKKTRVRLKMDIISNFHTLEIECELFHRKMNTFIK
jgi:hypothetical protein